MKKGSAKVQVVGVEDIMAAISKLTPSTLDRVEMFVAATPNLSKKDLQRIVKALYEKKGEMMMKLDGDFTKLISKVFAKAE